MSWLKKIPQQLVPLAIIFFLVIVALVVARQLLVPDTFGDYGHYRAAAVEEVKQLPAAYAGVAACGDCHYDMYETLRAAHHEGLSCEVCHEAALVHAQDPGEMLPAIPRGRDFCTACHTYNAARPQGFPQILANLHNPAQSCMECHDPHDPAPPHSPDQCSACHREIVNQKSVSHHARLECTTCHSVPEEHLKEPHLVRAKKPTENTLCGGCHAEDAESETTIPRIDLDSHAGRYNCWDCHYPHYPETRL